MKKYLIPTLCVLLLSIAVTGYLVMKSSEAKKNSIATRPMYVKTLKDGILAQNITIENACKNPGIVNKKVLEITDATFEERFIHLCDDHKLSLELTENFNSNTDYRYFLNCAKAYAAQMQQVMSDLKEHYPEDYKNLNFLAQDVLYRYLKHPDSAHLQAQCESKSEALYWKSLAQSNIVEDLKFCIQITQECISGKSKPEECPADFKAHNEACSKKLSSMSNH